jgi:MOSC domain-containing protein YiiM
MSGTVVSIHIVERSGGPAAVVPSVRALAARGLEGDRIVNEAKGAIDPDRQLTLIEAEALEALQRDYGVALSPAESRRNVCTRGVSLNHLVGRTFRIGAATARGIRLCEPCGTMEKLSGQRGACKGLVHRGGLRAEIVEGGVIRAGDAIVIVERKA